MDKYLAKVSQTYVQTQVKIVKVKTVIHSQVTLWRFKVIKPTQRARAQMWTH